jgi:hypothetical protein
MDGKPAVEPDASPGVGMDISYSPLTYGRERESQFNILESCKRMRQNPHI